MSSVFARVTWYFIMILSTGGLIALDIYTHDFNYLSYVFLGIAALLINTVIKSITLIKWVLEKKVVEVKVEVEPENEQPAPKPELSIQEQLERKYAKIRAENQLKDINASKVGEQTKNKHAPPPDKKKGK